MARQFSRRLLAESRLLTTRSSVVQRIYVRLKKPPTFSLFIPLQLLWSLCSFLFFNYSRYCFAVVAATGSKKQEVSFMACRSICPALLKLFRQQPRRKQYAALHSFAHTKKMHCSSCIFHPISVTSPLRFQLHRLGTQMVTVNRLEPFQ